MPLAPAPESAEFYSPYDSPHHGYRGDADGPEQLPLALSVAISRETGSRGIVVAKTAAKKLGWAFYNQEALEYLVHEGNLERDVFAHLDDAQRTWVEGRLAELRKVKAISDHESIQDLVRVILALGVKGEAVFLGRGAGLVLPRASTLHVRVVAPVLERVAFLTQLERLTPEQAAEQVTVRDQRRSEFFTTHFHRLPSDLNHFDLLVNTVELGEDVSTQIVIAAAKLKAANWAERQEQPGEFAG